MTAAAAQDTMKASVLTSFRTKFIALIGGAVLLSAVALAMLV